MGDINCHEGKPEKPASLVEKGPDRRLLIVDDEIAFGNLIAEVAVGLGFEVSVTSTGDEFCTEILRLKPSHVSLDMVMPGRDGIELLKWLEMQDVAIDVIMISGFNPRHMDVSAITSEASKIRIKGRLKKPVTLAILRSALYA